jgi:hypothetical protein
MKTARKVCSNVNSMLIEFLNIQEVVHCEFVPQGQPVSQHYYTDTLT